MSRLKMPSQDTSWMLDARQIGSNFGIFLVMMNVESSPPIYARLLSLDFFPVDDFPACLVEPVRQ